MRTMYIHRLDKKIGGTIVFKEIPAGGAIVCKIRPYDDALGALLAK